MFETWLGHPETAHPRVSGENRYALSGVFSLEGSSPRERGKQLINDTRTLKDRLIPA